MSSGHPTGEQMLGCALKVHDALQAAGATGQPAPATALLDAAWLVSACRRWRGELDTIARLSEGVAARRQKRAAVAEWLRETMTDA